MMHSSVDAAREDGSLGRLVNDHAVNPNSKMKVTRVDGRPHLCLFALKDIGPGEEVTYNCGDSDWPWRNKVFRSVAILSQVILSALNTTLKVISSCSTHSFNIFKNKSQA
ncbi:hypothetical protein ILYODFUR_033976 [Ilyodon furcidens]|uniref:SET domain-containing protein n=1 Tax=Ilyodon furcidens TaxID=33524 RepID=A0ABV0VJC2_9TELE